MALVNSDVFKDNPAKKNMMITAIQVAVMSGFKYSAPMGGYAFATNIAMIINNKNSFSKYHPISFLRSWGVQNEVCVCVSALSFGSSTTPSVLTDVGSAVAVVGEVIVIIVEGSSFDSCRISLSFPDA